MRHTVCSETIDVREGEEDEYDEQVVLVNGHNEDKHTRPRRDSTHSAASSDAGGVGSSIGGATSSTAFFPSSSHTNAQPSACQKHRVGTKSKFKHKVLLECCLVLSFSGLYYNFDTPVGMHQVLKQELADEPDIIANFEVYYNVLYGALAWPNIIVPLVIGWLSDTLGNRTLLALLSVCGIIGQSLMAVGCSAHSIWVMVIGRCISGIGIGSIFSMCSKFVSPYFKGTWLSFVQSLNIALGCCADALSIIATPWLAEQSGSLVLPLTLSVLTCGIGLAAQIVCNHYDSKAEKLIAEHEALVQHDTGDVGGEALPVARQSGTRCNIFGQLRLLSHEYWTIAVFLFFMYSVYLTALANFVPIMASLQYGPTAQLTTQQQNDLQYAAFLTIFLQSIVLPLSGYLVDQIGHHGQIALLSAAILTSSVFLVHQLPPIAFSLMMAASFSLFISSAWTLIPHLVEHDQLGIAYGVVMSLKFFGCTLFTLIAGYIDQKDCELDEPFQNLLTLLGVLAATSCVIMLYYCLRFKTRVVVLTKAAHRRHAHSPPSAGGEGLSQPPPACNQSQNANQEQDSLPQQTQQTHQTGVIPQPPKIDKYLINDDNLNL